MARDRGSAPHARDCRLRVSATPIQNAAPNCPHASETPDDTAVARPMTGGNNDGGNATCGAVLQSDQRCK